MPEVQASLIDEMAERFNAAKVVAKRTGNRGPLRALTWGSKVAAIQISFISRFLKSPDGLLGDDKRIYVCDACGFIYAGESAPDICPVCKAPSSRFSEFK